MPKPFMVVAYYTVGTPYEEEVNNLIASCDKFNIAYQVEGYESRGAWVLNCAIKPEFILDKLRDNPEYNIVYLDADAIVRKYPVLFEKITADIGVHYRRGKELLSGTIFLRNSSKTHELVRLWVHRQSQQATTWDQKVLQKAIEDSPVKVRDLPSTYTQIFDTMKGDDPVIEHMQASRRFKRQIETTEPRHERIPKSLAKMRIWRNPDGTYSIARNHKHVEAWMDRVCERVPNELKWTPRPRFSKNLDELQTVFEGKPVYIVGKGPSLDSLSEANFKEDYPIIALNEAIHRVEALDLKNKTFVLQQDSRLRDTCKPKHSGILVSEKAMQWYLDEENIYIVHHQDFRLSRSALSVVAAIEVAKRYGSTSFIFACFDACVNRSTQYAKCVGYKSTWGGDPTRFLTHRASIAKYTTGYNLEWILPND